jgi:hypothetical protein
MKLCLTTSPFTNDIISVGFWLGWYDGNHNAFGAADQERKFFSGL